MRRLTAALVVAVLALAPHTAGADTLEPSAWPPELGLGSAPNAIRFGGTDRYQTSLAAALALRGAGGFPFDTADRTTGQWWGAATCPKSIIVVAGDTPADSLAAASLSDPSNRGNEPRLQRVASADPFFDIVGDTDLVDTDAAPIIVTTSGRSGARGLAAPARAAAADLRSGGCTTAREAIIVGGEAAVPVAVEGELLELGYEEIFRVGGADRADTAARIAVALGTEAPQPGADCLDERSDDGSSAMGFYGNAVIEYRPDAASCQLQGRAVLLVEGQVGADALAAGWWTSYWQVPVLFVSGDGSLPPPTRAALESMAIDSLVVLGGTGRIPEAVVEDAARLASAVAGRFAGQDRYETSVISAKVFGGWHPTGDATDFASDRVCVAASSGTTRGWPDALTAGPWCGRLAAEAEVRRSPTRVLDPVGLRSTPVVPRRPAHDAVPVLLVPAEGGPGPAVHDLLTAAFPSDVTWCRTGTTFGCSIPGFAIAFGGTAAVADEALESVSAALSGGDAAQRGADPVLRSPFRTQLDLSPVYRLGAAAGPSWGCVGRDGLEGVRWLAVYADRPLTTFLGALDLASSDTYRGATSAPTCVGLGTAEVAMVGVTASGRPSAVHALSSASAGATTMSSAMVHTAPRTTGGVAAESEEPRAQTSWRFRDAPPAALQVTQDDRTFDVLEATADVYLTRGGEDDPTRFAAEIVLGDGTSEIVGQVAGDAVLDGTRWELAGSVRLEGASGGFRATIRTHGTLDNGDDGLTWRIDAIGS